MYVVAAERQGAKARDPNGTLQTDTFGEYIAQKEWLYPPVAWSYRSASYGVRLPFG